MSNLMMAEGWKTQETPKGKLSSGEKLVLIALCDQANDSGECFRLNSTLMEKCSMSERAVRDNLSKLEEKGLIEREFRSGRSTIFYLYPGRFFRNPRRFTPADLAPTPADLAPTPADLAPTPADLAPITLFNPTLTQSNPTLTNSASPADSAKPQAADGKKAKPKVDLVLPAWMPQELWQDVIDHRKSMKCPVTTKALQTVLQDLEKHHSAGQNLREMLTQSVVNGWKGMFPVKAQPAPASKNSSGNRNNYFNHGEENGNVVCPV